jgi:hypothetical protein
MSKKFILLFALFLLLLTALFAIQRRTSDNATSKVNPLADNQSASSSLKTTNLSLLPSQLMTAPGKPASLIIFANSRTTSPNIIQFEIAYDPEILMGMTISSGDLFINPTILLQSINERTGRISYAIETASDEASAKTEGAVAILNFIPNPNVSRAQTDISFLPKTLVRGKGEENILGETHGATITIQASSSAPLTR